MNDIAFDRASAALRSALVDAFPGFVRERLQERGSTDVPNLDDAIERGASWLDRELGDLLGRPAPEQRRSPLEVFQEAVRYPTEALDRAGLPRPARDEVTRNALPGDVHDLAPASSQDLGEDVWRLHLAWGAAKAAEIAEAAGVTASRSGPQRPRAGLVSGDLMDRSKVESAASGAGYDLAVWRTPGDIEPGGLSVVFVDLTHPEADAVLRRLAGSVPSVVAYGPHVDDLAMERAVRLGATAAEPRSRFFRSIDRHLPAFT